MARSTCVFVVALVAAACGDRSLDWQEAPPTADEWSDLSFAPARPDAGVMVFRDAALPPIERPGEVDVKIGEAASGETLEGDAIGEVHGLGDVWADYDAEGRPVPLPIHLVMDFPYQAWTGEGSWVHLVALDTDLTPLPGAEVFFNRALIGRADENGTFVFRKRPSEEQPGTGGVLTVRAGTRTRSVRFSSFARTPTFEATTIYAYTDRGVVQPGRTVHLRALAWRLRGEYRALPDHPLTVELRSPSGRLVGGGSVRTDEWGVANLDLPIPAHAEEGSYELTVSSGDERAISVASAALRGARDPHRARPSALPHAARGAAALRGDARVRRRRALRAW